ncbi:MAG: 3-methyl-2-oxobutanoate hydroxymethyltransferase [Alphaproteobacteria bacterium]|nr:3-methyl-2-oxobutanoate hydroxymethyltransferase [Alphaproteobacteria bacterium]
MAPDHPVPGDRITPEALRERKSGVPIVALTAYSKAEAQRLDPLVDVILVGDSVAMVVYGMDTTVGVTVETMIAHGRAVMRGARRACVVVDLPAGSYERSPEQAYATAMRIIAETGAAAVKLEGGVGVAPAIRRLVGAGIAVMGHVGLLPQAVTEAGGFRVQGRDDASAIQIMNDAVAAADAGAFAIVVEGTVEPLARQITETVRVPTIGIGASPGCDGQVLVTHDMLGLFADFTPKFVRRYAELGAEAERAVRAYADDVRARRFPGPEHCFGVKSAKPQP